MAASGRQIASAARLLTISRNLYERSYVEEEEPLKEGDYVLGSVELVEEYGNIGKEIRRLAKELNDPTWIEEAGNWLIEQIKNHEDNPQLQRYLLSIVASLNKSNLSPPVSLLRSHLRLLTETDDTSLLVTAQSYASRHPTDAVIQFVRLQAEIDSSSDVESTRKACEEAVKTVTQSEDQDTAGIIALWRLWAQWEDEQTSSDPVKLQERWRYILRLSLRIGSMVVGVHDQLLILYMSSLYYKVNQSLSDISQLVTSTYRPTPESFRQLFQTIRMRNDRVIEEKQLAGFVEGWKSVCKGSAADRLNIAVEYLSYLMENGKGAEAYRVYQLSRREVGEFETDLDTAWSALADSAENKERGESSESSDEDDLMVGA